MRIAAPLLVACLGMVLCLGQSSSSKWEPATIMAVQAHPPAAGEGSSQVRYDVTLRVGTTEYIVLYVPPDGTLRDIVKYRLGMDGLVLVGTDTIKYNDILAITREVPIISRHTITRKGNGSKLEKHNSSSLKQ